MTARVPIECGQSRCRAHAAGRGRAAGVVSRVEPRHHQVSAVRGGGLHCTSVISSATSSITCSRASTDRPAVVSPVTVLPCRARSTTQAASSATASGCCSAPRRGIAGGPSSPDLQGRGRRCVLGDLGPSPPIVTAGSGHHFSPTSADWSESRGGSSAALMPFNDTNPHRAPPPLTPSHSFPTTPRSEPHRRHEPLRARHAPHQRYVPRGSATPAP